MDPSVDPTVVADVRDEGSIPSLHAREGARDLVITSLHDGDLHDDLGSQWIAFGLTDYRCCYFES